MQPTNLTLEERERWAYANGDVEHAKLLQEAEVAAGRLLAVEWQKGHDAGREGGYAEGYKDGEEFAYSDCRR